MNSRFFSHIEVFVAIARTGSITEAADLLRLSKSNVSQKLVELEQDLDLKLFHRSTRKVGLTQAGQALLEGCSTAVDAVAHARSEIGTPGQQGPEITGVASLGGSNIYLTEYVLPQLKDFFDQFPNIRVRAIGADHPTDRETSGIDLRIRVGAIKDSGVKAYPLKPIERVICAAASAPFSTKSYDHPSQLAGQPVVLREQENTIWSFTQNAEMFQFQTPRPQVLANSYELCVQAARMGHGIAVLARDIVAADIAEGRMVQLLPNWHISPLPVSLTVPHSKLAKPHIKALTTFLVDRLK